jgi:hypothetical protein
MSEGDVHDDDAVTRVRHWVEQVVIGLSLCPFARSPWRSGTVRLARCDSADPAEQLSALWLELERLVGTDPAELSTTLLVLDGAPGDFDDFLGLTDLADEVVRQVGVEGVVQVVPFHPSFRFASLPVDDPAHGVNRSPVALWHLLREEEVETLRLRDPDLGDRVAEANRTLLRSLGGRGVRPPVFDA